MKTELLVAVHVQPVAVVMLTAPAAKVAGKFCDAGLSK